MSKTIRQRISKIFKVGTYNEEDKLKSIFADLDDRGLIDPKRTAGLIVLLLEENERVSQELVDTKTLAEAALEEIGNVYEQMAALKAPKKQEKPKPAPKKPVKAKKEETKPSK